PRSDSPASWGSSGTSDCGTPRPVRPRRPVTGHGKAWSPEVGSPTRPAGTCVRAGRVSCPLLRSWHTLSSSLLFPALRSHPGGLRAPPPVILGPRQAHPPDVPRWTHVGPRAPHDPPHHLRRGRTAGSRRH